MIVDILYESKYKKPVVFIDGEQAVLVSKWTRWVFRTSKYYLKIDKCPNKKDYTMIANHTAKELDIWNKYKDTEFEKYLCPILQTGETIYKTKYVIQPKCDIHKGRRRIGDTRLIYEVFTKMLLGDFGHNNWKYLNGKPVIIDFGL